MRNTYTHRGKARSYALQKRLEARRVTGQGERPASAAIPGVILRFTRIRPNGRALVDDVPATASAVEGIARRNRKSPAEVLEGLAEGRTYTTLTGYVSQAKIR